MTSMSDVILHLFMLLVLPPFIYGLIHRTKSIFAGRKGPPLLQLYFDLAKLLKKRMVFSETTTWIFRAGPVVTLLAIILAGLFIPLASAAPLRFSGDIILVAYLFALARFFLSLAALDTGSSFEGMGASREVAFAVLAEPAFFAGAIILARVTGDFSLSAMLSGVNVDQQAFAPLVLLALSWSILVLSENSRIPFDDPNTHLELTMIHEVMVLDHSGPALALIEYASSIKLFLMISLVAQVLLSALSPVLVPLLPDLTAVLPTAASIDGFKQGSLLLLQGQFLWRLAFLALVGLGAVAIGTVESTMARLRLTHIPGPLVSASLLALFGYFLLLGAP